jgi:hypothetical protein
MVKASHPGGESGKRCVRYTERKKYTLLATAQRLCWGGMSLNRAASEFHVSAANLSKWEKVGVGSMDPKDKLFKSKKKSNLPGPPSQLVVIDEALLHYIFEQREQGFVVDTLKIVLRASFLFPGFREKSFTARCSAVKRWLMAHLMRYRMGTHTSQRPPAKVASEALDYIVYMRRIVVNSNRNRHFILNMDQTPVYFAMSAKQMLELIGKQTIHIRTTADDTKRPTVVVTIAVDGTLLPSMIIFKGAPNERIARMEFAAYPTTNHYRCQENAWMDEQVMLAWVNEVLVQYVATAPDNVVPLLILDSYRCHMMGSVIQRIQELDVEVQHIPGGCTSLCQPVNIGFNKPCKDRIRRAWHNWMMAEAVIHGMTRSPTRLDVAMWVANMMEEMKREGGIIRNAWKKKDYKWFVDAKE